MKKRFITEVLLKCIMTDLDRISWQNAKKGLSKSVLNYSSI